MAFTTKGVYIPAIRQITSAIKMSGHMSNESLRRRLNFGFTRIILGYSNSVTILASYSKIFCY